MHHFTASDTAPPDTSEVLSAEDIRVRLRPIISKWASANPGRIIMRVPLSRLEPMSDYDPSMVFNALRELESYHGAALRDPGTTEYIPWSYVLYPTLNSIEVLLVSDELVNRPVHRLAEEVALLIQEAGQSIPVDELFSFTVPVAALERRATMTQAEKSQFRTTLNQRMEAAGFFPDSGTVESGLEIRRNQNR